MKMKKKLLKKVLKDTIAIKRMETRFEKKNR
jgi:hypothetical protein